MAAAKGNEDAKSSLAYFFQYGVGEVPESSEFAARLFLDVAEQGSISR